MKPIERPNNFGTVVECVNWIKKSVYLIVRGRPINSKDAEWITLGTGCVVAPNRMITAAHVINSFFDKSELKHHKEGDFYYFIKCDDEANWHYEFFIPELNKSLFVYPRVDLAVFHVDDGFYQDNGKVYGIKDDYIRIEQKFKPIATEIAVLGYPLCSLSFNNNNINDPYLGNILLRVDSGVINCRYLNEENIYLYEFTITFNPGNSGGPIFDWRTGELLSIVHGVRTIPINMNEHILSDQEKKSINIKEYREKSFIDIIHANYSVGYATPSFTEIFKAHQII